MTIAKLLPALLIIIALYSCNENEIAQIATVPSSQCGSAITGVEGLYWDISNGFARGDIPGGVPTVNNPGGQFTHPTLPLLGFQYPAGWSPTALTDPATQTIGVNLFRNDGNAIYRMVSSSVSGFFTVDDVFNFELNGMLSTFGVGNPVFICTNQGSDNSTGLTISGRSAFIRAGGVTSIINVNTTHVPGLSSTFINVQVTAAPTAEYETEVLATFLPIGWQLLYRPSGSTVLEDRDGDGVPDIQDNFPDDPTRQ